MSDKTVKVMPGVPAMFGLNGYLWVGSFGLSSIWSNMPAQMTFKNARFALFVPYLGPDEPPDFDPDDY